MLNKPISNVSMKVLSTSAGLGFFQLQDLQFCKIFRLRQSSKAAKVLTSIEFFINWCKDSGCKARRHIISRYVVVINYCYEVSILTTVERVRVPWAILTTTSYTSYNMLSTCYLYL